MKTLDRALELAIYYASALLMLALTGGILYAVVARYFFNAAPIWSEEVPRVIFLWVTFLLEKFPPLGRLWLELFMHGSIFVMLGFLFWHNVPVIELNRGSRMLATQWPDAVRYWPLSVG